MPLANGCSNPNLVDYFGEVLMRRAYRKGVGIVSGKFSSVTDEKGRVKSKYFRDENFTFGFDSIETVFGWTVCELIYLLSLIGKHQN